MKKGFLFLTSAVLALSTIVSGCSSNQPASSSKDKSANTSQNEAPAADTPEYPTKQVEYVVPFPAGGGVDLIARAVADQLSKEWKQPVIVVNKPGGGGAVGAQAALKQSNPDGYTVLAQNQSSTTMLSAGMSNPPVKLEDHIFVSRVVLDPMAFVVKADAPWKDLNEFSEWVKKNPEQLTYTSVGPAGVSSFAVAEWLDKIGVDFKKPRMITTKGSADAMPKIAGGHAVLAVHSVNEVSTMVKSGKVKILAIASSERSPYFPDAPTTEELGIKGLTAKFWTGVSLPVGTPDYIVKKWAEATEKLSKDPAFLEKLKNMNVQAGYMGTEEYNKFIKDEAAYWTDIATKYGIRK